MHDIGGLPMCQKGGTGSRGLCRGRGGRREGARERERERDTGKGIRLIANQHMRRTLPDRGIMPKWGKGMC
jgi:hypothetical protein